MRSKTVDRLLKSTPKETEIFVDLYADLVVRVNQILGEKGLTQKDLANRMEKSPSEISKWLNGEHNFTLRSLAKLSAELGEPLLEVPKKGAHVEFVEDGFVRRTHTVVSYTKLESKALIKDWQVAEETTTNNLIGNAA